MPRFYCNLFFSKIKPHPFYLLPGLFFVFILVSGCAGPRVRVGDEQIEKPLLEATGVQTQQVRDATSKKELGLWDAYALAVERTERLASRYESLEQAKAVKQQAVGSYIPHVYLNSSKGIWGPSGNSSGVSLSLHGNQALLTGFNEIAALKGAKALVRQRQLELRFDAQRLLLDVARSYYGVLQLQESLRNEQASNELAQKMLKEQRVFRVQGRIRESDVLSSETELASSDANLVSIQDQLEQAREQFALLTGTEEDRVLADANPAAFPNVPSTLEQALKETAQRPDVLAAKENLQVQKSTLLAAEGGYAPVISAQGDIFMSHQGTVAANAPKWDAYLSASLPIFTGGQTEGKIRESKSMVRQAELQMTQTLHAAREEVRQAYTAFQNSVKQDAAYQKALTAAVKSHKAQSEDYRLKLTNVVQYLQSLTDLESAQLNAARSRYQWRIQRVWLGVATGRWPNVGAESNHSEVRP
jgi:outer membrane protein TolC